MKVLATGDFQYRTPDLLTSLTKSFGALGLTDVELVATRLRSKLGLELTVKSSNTGVTIEVPKSHAGRPLGIDELNAAIGTDYQAWQPVAVAADSNHRIQMRAISQTNNVQLLSCGITPSISPGMPAFVQGHSASSSKPWTDINVFGFYESLRGIIRPLTREAVLKTLLPEIHSGSTVLEVGSGIGELRHALIRDQLAEGARWIETDQNQDFLFNDDTRPYASERVLAKLPSLSTAAESVDIVCGLGVLDVLTKPDLDASFQEFARVLKPGGRVIEILDIAPDLAPFVTDAKERGQVPFKHFQKLDSGIITITGIFYVSESNLDQFIKSNPANVKAALNYHRSFPYDALVSSDSRIGTSMAIQQLMEDANLIERTDHLDKSYKEKLIDSAAKAGLVVEKAENHKEERLVEKSTLRDVPTGKNKFTSINGIYYWSHDPTLEATDPGKVKLESETLVFVARKS